MPNGKTKSLEEEFIKTKTYVMDGNLAFAFSKSVNLELLDNRVIKITAHDPDRYFNFTFLNAGQKNILENMHVSFSSNLNTNFKCF